MSFVKIIEVADATVLYSLVLLMLRDDPSIDPITARAIFKQATDIDPRYNYKGWVKKIRMYPKQIEDVYMSSGFYSTMSVDPLAFEYAKVKNMVYYERFPMDTLVRY